jgi:hypothetical protein
MKGSSPWKTGEVNFKFMLTGLILLMLTGPVLHEYTSLNNQELLEIVFAGSFLLLIASISGNLRVFWLALVPALIALICAVLAILLNSLIFRYFMLVAALTFFLVAVRYASREVFRAAAVDLNKVIGSICIYLLLVICWAIAYEFLELLTPGSFNGIALDMDGSRFDQFVYFSLVTITTLGYGDTAPTNLVAGFFAGMEALVGVFYIAILVASLVGDFMSRQKSKPAR